MKTIFIFDYRLLLDLTNKLQTQNYNKDLQINKDSGTRKQETGNGGEIENIF